MNRAEMRRQAKKNGKKDKIYYLTQAQIDKMKQEVAEEAVIQAVDRTFAYMLSIPTNVLARCYWEKSAPKRIPQFLDECLSVYESVGSGTLTLDELIEDTEKLGKLKMDISERIKKLRK